MYKKTAKPQEQMDKNIDNKQAKDRGDSSKKTNVNLDKLNLASTYHNNQSKNILYDRGDTKKPKNDNSHTKYDTSKNNKAVEVNNPVKAVTNVTKRNKEVYDSVPQNQKKIVSEVKPQPLISSKTIQWKISREKNIIDKKPPYQKTNQKPVSDRLTDVDSRKAKIKEVITIPYKPLDDTVTQEVEDDLTGEEKLIINSVPSKNSTMKISKAVSFKDPLNISNRLGKNYLKAKSLDANFKRQVVVNKTKVQSSVKASKRRKKKNNSPSSNKSDNNEFAPPKVAQWAPSCLTSHTRPYYEAWVDTSVTAVSRCSEKEKLMIEKELIKSFQESKRPVTPEEMYGNFNDEKFMGRIIVRHKHLGVKSKMSNRCSE